jgi:hypothetical protein
MTIFVVMYRTFKSNGSLDADTPLLALPTETRAREAIAGLEFDFQMTATDAEKAESSTWRIPCRSDRAGRQT